MVLFSCTNLALSAGIEYIANPNETLVSLDILQILCKYCVILEVFFSVLLYLQLSKENLKKRNHKLSLKKTACFTLGKFYFIYFILGTFSKILQVKWRVHVPLIYMQVLPEVGSV